MRFLFEVRRCSSRKISQLPRLDRDNLRVLEIRRCSPVSFYWKESETALTFHRGFVPAISMDEKNFEELQRREIVSFNSLIIFTLFFQSCPSNLLRCSFWKMHYSSGILESKWMPIASTEEGWKKSKSRLLSNKGSSNLRNEICIWGDI